MYLLKSMLLSVATTTTYVNGRSVAQKYQKLVSGVRRAISSTPAAVLPGKAMADPSSGNKGRLYSFPRSSAPSTGIPLMSARDLSAQNPYGCLTCDERQRGEWENIQPNLSSYANARIFKESKSAPQLTE